MQVRVLRPSRASAEATLACPNRAPTLHGAIPGRTGSGGLPCTPPPGGLMARRDFGTVRRLPSGRWGRDTARPPATASRRSGRSRRGQRRRPTSPGCRRIWTAVPTSTRSPEPRPSATTRQPGLPSAPISGRGPPSCTRGCSLGTSSHTWPLCRWPDSLRRWSAGGTPADCSPGSARRRSPSPIGSSRPSSTPPSPTRSSPAIHACSAAPAANAHRSGCRRRCSRRTPWRMPSSPAGGCSSCWPPGPGCAGASSSPYAVAVSTSSTDG